MAQGDKITKALAIADVSLREFFPDDYFKRCMYASFGIAALLKDEGIQTQIVGGDFICAVVSKDGSQMNLEGFGTASKGAPSHYWVEALEQRLDLGLMYLPQGSRLHAAHMPALRWPLAIGLPDFIAYRERERYVEDVEIDDPEFKQRNANFLAHCRDKRSAFGAPATLAAWQLRDFRSLRYAAHKKDAWAMAATIFLRRSLKAHFPYD
jgi:hypothetical protein